MVQSKLNKSINYFERRHIEEDDLGYSSSLYEIELFDNELKITVVIGRVKLTHVNKNIVYFPIYITDNNDKIRGQIGIFEINAASKDITKYTNKDLEIDEEKLGEPLLYSFVSKKYLKKVIP